MIEIKNKINCTSCGACYNICPVNAIEMVEDNEGFKYPKVDAQKCIQCGLCDKTCPIYNKKEINNSKTPKVFAAWSKDEFIRLDSTSGGIFSELAKQIYSENGYVCGAVYNEEWMVEHFISNNIKDLDKIRSSKYLQSNINYIFREIKEKLINGSKVLFCGSPCQVHGLYNYLQKDYKNLITVDFICRGMNSPKIFKKYIENLEQKYKSKISYIKFKNKINGWHNFSTKIDFENGNTYIGGRYYDSYMIGYLKYNAFMRPSCYDCKFKDLPKMADITVADFWGIENINKKLDENKGTSMVLINSKQGEELFEQIKKNINFQEIVSNKIFEGNICMQNSVEKTPNRQLVFENIDNLSYEELHKKYFPSPNLIEKVKIFFNTNKYAMKIKKIIKRK
ncbi:MAG: Coenzyme F420 hydrogenase/dehydrogenase, beta subunit C-terminal domain [Clostridia bacterium]|nr:Coenzyme F420 hydrogenase/dehydrogenase, beta subunit C-terminal domain [Clostridia bacterium]